mgnify:CR=1 FL=1
MSNTFEMFTWMAIVLLGGFLSLNPDTILAASGSRAETVECLSLNPCCEGRFLSASMMDGRIRRSRILAAGHNSEIGRLLRLSPLRSNFAQCTFTVPTQFESRLYSIFFGWDPFSIGKKFYIQHTCTERTVLL